MPIDSFSVKPSRPSIQLNVRKLLRRKGAATGVSTTAILVLSAQECGVEECKRLHHPLLHGAPRMYPKLPSTSSTHHPSSTNPFSGTVSHGDDDETTLLPIVPVLIELNSRTWSGYGLLDPGSQISMITNTLANELRLEGKRTELKTGTYHGCDTTADTTKVSFKIYSRDKRSSFF